MEYKDPTHILLGDIILVDGRLFIKVSHSAEATSGMFYIIWNTKDDQEGFMPKGEPIKLTFSEPVTVLTNQDIFELNLDALVHGRDASSLT